jgi:hypothetical protein
MNGPDRVTGMSQLASSGVKDGVGIAEEGVEEARQLLPDDFPISLLDAAESVGIYPLVIYAVSSGWVTRRVCTLTDLLTCSSYSQRLGQDQVAIRADAPTEVCCCTRCSNCRISLTQQWICQ